MENILINVDSQFRDKKKYPNPAKFTYVPSDKFKNVQYIRLSSVELPNIWYDFTAERNNISFKIIIEDTGEEHDIIISEGIYTSDDFLVILKRIFDQLNIIHGYNLQIWMDQVKYTATISNYVSGSSGGQVFTLDFRRTFETPYDSLGVIMGFQKPIYSGLIEYEAEDVLDVIGDAYCFLRVNDYGIIYNQVLNKRILGKVILEKNKTYQVFDNRNFLTKEYIFHQPVNMEKFEIELLDKYGQYLDLRGEDFSFTLELGLIENSKLYLSSERGVFGKN
jgi:hypothetical protein